MEFQTCGDYHYRNLKKIEPQNLPEKKAKYLIITGDISYSFWVDLEPFYRYCAENWEKVFVTLGNQEYLCGNPANTMAEFEKIYQELFKKINEELKVEKLILLNKSCYDISGTDYRIAGTTLWPANYEFNFLSGTTGQDIYNQEESFLESTFQSSLEEQKKLIIVTHWVPTLHARPSKEFEEQILSNGQYTNGFPTEKFCIDKSYLFKPPLLMWVCGHIHSPQIVYENGFPVYVNCDTLC